MNCIVYVRNWLWTAPLVSFALCAVACPLSRGEENSTEAQPPQKLRVVVMGAHPDDPEAGAGGLIAALTDAGHEVIIGYLCVFREGRKCFDRPEAEVRREEADAACKILGATPKFFPFSAGRLIPDTATVQLIATWLSEVKPDIVMTHWPCDTHPDHHAISSIVWQCYRHRHEDGGTEHGPWNLYYFEVVNGIQTLNYKPELYFDVGAFRDRKEEACICHKSQNFPAFWREHDRMHRERGTECGVEYAEAYSLVEPKTGCKLLPVPFLSQRH